MHYKLCIDPGHGLPDPGAVAHGQQEHHINLAVAKRMAFHVNRHGTPVQLTRNSDNRIVFNGNTAEHRNADLNARPDIAIDMKATHFISIHVNAATRAEARGAEVFVKALNTPSATLANRLLTEYNRVTGLTPFSRGTKTAAFRVLNRLPSSIEGCLFELEFITNADARSYMASEVGIEQMAVGLAQGYLKHIGVAWRPVQEPWHKPIIDNMDKPDAWIAAIEHIAKNPIEGHPVTRFIREFTLKLGGK